MRLKAIPPTIILDIAMLACGEKVGTRRARGVPTPHLDDPYRIALAIGVNDIGMTCRDMVKKIGAFRLDTSLQALERHARMFVNDDAYRHKALMAQAAALKVSLNWEGEEYGQAEIEEGWKGERAKTRTATLSELPGSRVRRNAGIPSCAG